MLEKVIVTGNIGKDATGITTGNGNQGAKFAMAASRRYKQNNEQREETHWFNVTVWGTRAEAVLKYAKKGAKIQVIGRLAADPQTGGPKVFTRNDGRSSASYDLIAEDFDFVVYAPETRAESPHNNSNNYNNYGDGRNAGNPSYDDNMDIPF